ncbi:hypothetical protein PROFUN_08719 [Planoprotostelium fungivorum]|uniref:Uncharacterized protein n=1 Tax=Planoprotostelium fungivorum TaxID=1890364 RepID=A0A2P6MQW8_9EUKA|nr:hypothetical protein PROFUN_08719 [Planoprotostelium fungivorum]
MSWLRIRIRRCKFSSERAKKTNGHDTTSRSKDTVGGAAKAATVTWITTATEIELDLWLTFSEKDFIDAANGKARRPRGGRHKNGRANMGNINLAREDQEHGRDSWEEPSTYGR